MNNVYSQSRGASRTFGRWMTMLLIVLTGMFSATQVSAQLAGTYSIPGDYATIQDAVAALNTSGVGAGGATFNVAAGHTETLTTRMVMTASGTSADPIIFQKSGAGANPIVTAYSGTVATPSAVADGMWILSGSDFVTIDGIDLQESGANTTTAQLMEFGFGLLKASVTNGCQDNTIKNCVITLNRLSNTAWTAPGHNGSIGIVVLNATSAAATALTPTSAAGSNSRNKFYSNTIQNCNAGIALVGFAATTGTGPLPDPNTFLGDLSNDIGGSSAATGNTILNFGGSTGATNPATGIFANQQWTLNCSYNTINNNNGSGVNHVNTLRGIFFNTGSTGAAATCNNNTVTIKGGGTTSQVSGIENTFGGTTPAGNTISINNNTISGQYLTATTGAFYGIYSNGVTPATLNISSNTISGITYGDAALTGSGVIYPIYTVGSNATSTFNLTNNTVSNISRTGTSGGTTIGIFQSGGIAGFTVNATGNTVTNLSIDGAGTASTMYGIQTGTGNISCNNNNVNTLSCIKTTGTSALYGIYNIASPTIESYNNNTIHSLIHNGTGIVYGLFASTTTGTRSVVGNTIYNLLTSGTTIAGINNTSSSPNVRGNKIYNVQSLNTGAATVSGIIVGSLGTAGSATIANNIIGDLKAPAASSTTGAVRGINITTTTASTNIAVQYNTVYLEGSSTGANFSSAALYVTASTTATTANLTIRNNIFVNNTVPTGTGIAAAHWRSSTALNNFNTASNNNVYSAGVPAANRLIFFDGTNSDQSLSAYKTRVAAEAASISETPDFLSVTGADATFLHIDTATPTFIESGGTPIVGFTTDFDGDTRNASTPDIGADEFAGSQPANCAGIPAAGSATLGAASICANLSTSLSNATAEIANGITYQWYISTTSGSGYTAISGANGVNASTGNLAAGTYYIVMSTKCTFTGDSSLTAEAVLTVNPRPTADAVASGAACTNQSVTLNLTTDIGVTFSWTGPASFTSVLQSPTLSALSLTNSGNYIVVVTSAVGCTSTDTVAVSVKVSPEITAITATPAQACYTGSVQLGATVVDPKDVMPTGYCAQAGSTTSNGDEQIFSVSFGSMTNAPTETCSSNNKDYTTTVPAVDVTPGSSYPFSVITNECDGATFYSSGLSIFIDYNRDGDFADAGEQAYTTTATTQSPNTRTGNITIPATAAAGLTRMRVVVIENAASPGACATFSFGEVEDYAINIQGAGASYSWSPATDLSSSTIVNPVASGFTASGARSYILTMTTGDGCTVSDTADFTVGNAFSATATAIDVTCDGILGSATATATGGNGTYSYAWSPSGGSADVATGLSAGTYTCVVTDAFGCTTSASATVNNPVPAVITATAGANGSISPSGAVNVTCGTNQLFSITPDAGYQVDSLVVNGVNLGIVTSYLFNNVTANGSITAYFGVSQCNNPPTASTPSVDTICAGSAYTLSGSIGGGASTGTWSSSGSGTFNSTAFGTGTNYSPSAADITAGSVTITLTTDDPDGAGSCIAASSSTVVSFRYNPTVVNGLLGICTGGSTTLTAVSTPASTAYSWSTGATTQSITVNSIGTYTVSATGANGCVATVSVNVIDAPTYTVSISDDCASWVVGNTKTLTATPSVAGTYTYSWSGGGTAATKSVTAAGTYTVTVTDAFGCTQTASFTVGGAPLSGTYTIGGSGCGQFSNLANAVSHLSSFGVSGNVIIDVPAGYAETAPAGGFQIKTCALASANMPGAAQTVTIRKSGSGANPVLTASTGTTTNLDGLFKIVGADNITIDAINLQENAANTTNTTRMEWGYAVLKCDSNGANNIVIQNCNISLNKANTGSNGIYTAAHGEASTTVRTRPSTGGAAADQAHRNQVSILNNTISNVYNGINLTGDASSSAAVLGASLNDSLSVVRGNNITNFGGGATTASAITYANQRNTSVRQNTISGGNSTTTTLYAINASSGVSADISLNTITINSNSSAYGINVALTGGSATNPNIVKADSNSFVNFVNNGTGIFYALYQSAGGDGAQLSIQGNTISGCSNASATATGGFYGIYPFGTAVNGTSNVRNNKFINNDFTHATGTIFGVYGSLTSGTLNLQDNEIRNNILGKGAGTTYLLYPASAAVGNITNNRVTNNRRVVASTSTSTGTLYGIYAIGGYATSSTVSNNLVDTLFYTGVPGTVTATVYGFYLSGTSPGQIVENNTVKNIYTTGATTGTQSIWGMSLLPSGSNTTIRNNRISTVYTGASNNGAIIGIQLAGSTTAGNTKFCHGNTISLLSAGGSSGNVRGIQLSGGTEWYVYNNAISRLTATASAPTTVGQQVLGIDISSTTTTNQYFIYNNSIYLSGNGGGGNFGSSGIHAHSGPAVTLVNNLVINLINPGASGHTVAYRRSSSTLTSYQAASNNNLFYAGTPAASRLIYAEGVTTLTNAQQTLAGFKTYVGPTRDANSQTEAATPFVSVATDSLLHIATTPATFVESGGKPYPATALTTDIDGQTRNSLAPDIGADEGNFTSLLPQILSVGATPATSQCVVTSRTIDVTTSASVTGVTLNYSYNGTAQTAIAFTGGSGVWTATLPAASPANATVAWSITATDGTYSVSANGTGYQDEYLSTNTLTAAIAPITICLGQPISLSSYIGSSAAAPTTYDILAIPSNTADEDLLSVTVGSLTQSSVCGTLAPGAGSIAYRYSNYTSNPAPLLIAGTSINYSLQAGTCGTTNYNNRCAIFIDLNRDGDFADAGERVAQTTPQLGPHTSTGSFTLPTSVSYGFTRMRIINNETTGDITPGAYSYGETEDYTVQLAGGAGFTYAWTDGVNPVTPSAGSYTPTSAGTFNYQVTGTDPNGCTIVSSAVVVTVNALPTAPTTTPSSQCGTAIPEVRAAGGVAYNWYNNLNDATPFQSGPADSVTALIISVTDTFYVASVDLLTLCESPRTEVIASVTQPDAINASVDNSTVCPGTLINLSVSQVGSSNTYVFTWNGTGLNTNSGTSVTANPTGGSTVSYVVTATDAALECVVTDTVVVSLIPPPVITSVTATPGVICANQQTTLTAQTNMLVSGSSAQIGAGTISSTLYAPYYTLYGGNKRQYIFTAAELAASGLVAGNISSISMDYTGWTGPYATLTGVTIQMGNTLISDFTTGNYEGGLTTVMTPTDVTFTTAAGTVTHNFTTPFNWNGTSNVIVQFCYSNNDAGYTTGASPSVTYTSTSPANRCIYSIVDNQDVATLCGNTSGTRTTIRPNMRFGGIVPGFGTGTYGWSWSDGSSTVGTGNSITQNPSVTTTYTVTATDPATGCTSSQSVPVTVNPLPTAPAATNSAQCGAGIPTASVASTSGMSTPGFYWYSAATGGTLLQGPGPATGPLQIYYTNNFASSLNGASLSGNASLTGGAAQLTPNVTANQGGLTIPASGVNADKYRVSFNLLTSALVNIGADGLSYSFANDASATTTTPAAETGSGTKLKVSFDSYGTSGGGIAGIRVIYGSTISNPGINVGTDNILAYSSVGSWAGAGSVPVVIDINNAGQLTLTVGGSAIFTNVQLPASYLTDNKSNWVHVFSARTGGVSQVHSVDDVTIEQAGPSGGYTTYLSSVSTTTTFYVSEINQTTGCEGPRTPVTVDVTQPDGIQASVSAGPYCLGGTVSLSVADTASSPQNTYTYSWSANSANAGLNSTSGASVTATPTVAGTYVYTATGVDGQCTVLSTVTVVMSANPSVDSISATPSAACAGAPVQLFAAGLTSGIQTLPSGYCAGGGSATTADEQIFGFAMGSLNNLNQSENCLQNNTDYTTSIPALTLIVGNSYPFTIQTNECDGPTYFSNGASIFIDYNRDGDWDDTGERVYTTTATTASPNTRTGTITIPVTATPGLTRMRVFVQESVASPLPCAAFSYGEIEDYTVNIIGLSAGANTFVWTPGGATGNQVTVTPTTTTTYAVTATSPEGCTATNSVTVNVTPLPAAVTAVDSVRCGFGPATVSVVSNSGAAIPGINWYNEASGGSAIQSSNSTSLGINVSVTDTFYVSEIDLISGLGCESPRTMVIQNVTQPDAVTASVSDTSICLPGASITLNATQTGSTNTYNYSWTSVPPAGSGLSGVNLGPATTLFSSDFNSATVPSSVTLNGTATLTGTTLQLTSNTTSQSGAVRIDGGGNAADSISVQFDLIVPQNGADGISYSYCGDGNFSATPLTFESGTGTALSISFDSYTNGSNTNGIYLMYPPSNQPTPASSNVLAYSSDVSWRASATPKTVAYTISLDGKLNLTLDGAPIFTNVQLPSAYLLANKSSWSHFFRARTGGVSEEHSIDNMTVTVAQLQSNPTPGQSLTLVPTLPGTYTYTVLANDGECNANSSVVVVVNPAAPAILAGADQEVCAGSNVTLNAASAGLIPALRFTEVLWQVNAGTGNTGAGIPAWASTWYTANGGTTMDMIELTNLGASPADFAGVQIELWNAASTTSGAPAYTYTFPSGGGFLASGDRLYFSHSGSAVVNDFTNKFFTRGPTSIDNGSGTSAGMVIRKNGTLIDAVAVSGYTFPSASGVTSADWSGVLASNSGLSGSVLVTADNNTASAWVNTSATTTASVGSLNTGLVANLPSLGTVQWSSIPAGFSGTSATSTFGPINVPTQFVVVFDNGTCQSSDTVLITPVTTPGTPTIASSADTLCFSGLSNYTVTNGNNTFTYQWQILNNATNTWGNISGATASTYTTPVYNPSVGTDYFYRVVASCGVNSATSNEDTLQIVRPGITSTVGDTVCGSGTVGLQVFGEGTFNWYETTISTAVINTGDTYSPAISSSTVYWVRASVGSCLDPAGRQPVYAIANPADPISVTPSAPTICAGQSATLTASSVNTGYVYTWNGTTTGSSVTVTPDSTRTYTVTGIDPATNCGSFTNVTVIVNQLPVITSVSSTPASACPGQPFQLTANAIATGPQTPPVGYCAGGGGTTTADEQIFGVSFGPMNNLGQGETCGSNNSDYTGSIPPINVNAGSTYPFTVVTDECDGATYFSSGLSIFIDYNRDGDFDDTGEQAFTTTATTISPNTRTGNITIPSNATLGVTRMRVKVVESVASPAACTVFTYGEAEDYLVNISGASASFNWTPAATLDNATIANPTSSGITASTTFTVTATSLAGCTGTPGSITVNVAPAPSPVITTPDTNLCNSEIYVQVADNGPYAATGFPAGTVFTWKDATGGTYFSAADADSISSLFGNSFFVTVNVPGGCVGTSDTAYVVTKAVTVVENINNASCAGGDGRIIANISSGLPPFNYVWSTDAAGINVVRNVTTSATADTLPNLNAGTYYLVVTDEVGAPASCGSGLLTFTVSGSTAIDANISGTDITCNGAGDGTATVTFTGGTAPINILWNDGSTDVSRIIASGGTFTVTVSDNFGCSDVATVTITEPAALAATLSTTQASAPGATDGTASAAVTGGTAPISIEWFDETLNPAGTGANVSGLAAGLYYVLITDANNCQLIETVTVTEITDITFNVTAIFEGFHDGLGGMVPALLNTGLGTSLTEVDTIRVELRDAISPTTVVASASAIINTSGEAQLTLPGAVTGGSYYLAVFHRNAVQTWSALPVTMANNGSYDFTSASSQAYFDNMVEVTTGVWAFFSGDVDPQDEVVDILDQGNVDNDSFNFVGGYVPTDINGDGVVDILDQGIVDNNAFNFIGSAHP